MSAVQAKAKSKERNASSKVKHKQVVPLRLAVKAGPARPVNAQAKAFYSAPPLQLLNLPVQAKVAIGRTNDPYECEADSVANRVVTGQSITSISTLPPGGLNSRSGAPAQRQEEKDESVQESAIQKQDDENESVQSMIQRQYDEEGEIAQKAPVIQRQEAETEEETEGEGESVQTSLIQRQEETDEPAQTEDVQRQEDESSEEDAQADFVQRQEDESSDENAQTDFVQRQDEGIQEPVQEIPLQLENEDENVQGRSAGPIGPPASPAMRATASHAIHNKGAGEPLNSNTRGKLESSMGVDLSEVRVHEDSSARQAAGGLKARAFTHKNNIWLGHGQSQSDLRLMAHESTHVLQQGGVVRRKPVEEKEEEKRPEEEMAGTEGGVTTTATRRPEVEPYSTEAPPVKQRLEPKSLAPKGTEVVPAAAVPATAEPMMVTKPPGEKEAAEEEKAATEEVAKTEKGFSGEPPETVAPAPSGSEAATPQPVAVSEEAPAATTEGPEVAKAPTPEGTKAKSEAKPASEVAKTSEKEPTVTGAEKAAVEEKAAAEPPAPPSPQADPKFKKVVGRLEMLSKQEKSHEPAPKKVAAARAASVPPENDRSSRAQANQVEVMDQQEAKKPDKDDFLSLLRKALESIAPKNMEETEEFKKKGKAGQLKATLNSTVSQKKEDSARDIKSAAQTEPDPKSVDAKEVKAIPAEPPNPGRPNLKSKDVLPEPKKEEEISVEHNKKKAEQLMAENDIDEEQLERANEPQFSNALKAKKELDEHADQVPQAYREEEQGYLDKTKAEVAAEEKSTKAAMRAKRNKGKSQVLTKQQEAKKKEEEERKRVADNIQKMYETTKKNVQDKLNSLDTDVNKLFDDGEKRARERFESYVDRRMSAYKYDRYISQTGGLVLWGWDKLTGMPDEVNRFYEEGRDQFIKDMDEVLVKIADTVEKRLKEAKDEIAKGKKKIREYVDELPKNLQKAGKNAEKNVSSQFDELEEGVDSKKQELAQNMARRYQESRKKLDERIEELKKANQGLVDAFIGKIKEIIEILRNFKNKVMSLMKQGGDALRKIVKDPGKFLDNLGAALKKGFNQFIDNFFKHLKAAFINWLFGTMSKAGIEIPTEFSFKGVFGLILQVIGITKDWIRSRVVKLIGAKNVERIEKAWSIVSTFISGGIGGLWEKAKEYLSDLKDKLFDTIQNWLITQIVKQAVIWVLSLLNPVSALLKIIKMIYDVVMFFVENIGRILQLVEAVIQSTAKIVAGNIGAAANWIESAMSRILPIIISFLARLLGISGISNKISSFIKGIQKKVRKVVDKILKKIVKGIKKLLGKGKAAYGKGKAAVKKAGKKLKELIFPKKRFKAGTESHTVEAKKSGKKHTIVVRSNTMTIPQVIDKARKDPVLKTDTTFQKTKVKTLETEYSKWPRMKISTPKQRKDKSDKYLEIFQLTTVIMKKLSNMSKSLARVSNIKWSTDTSGRSKKVEADPLTAKGPAGGTPGDKIPGWRTDYTESEYRLHLLHHKLHGPGRAFNLVPGSKKMNEIMKNVEMPTLGALGLGRKKKNTKKQGNVELKYTVTVGYGKPPSPLENTVAKWVKIDDVTGKDLSSSAKIKIPGIRTPDNY